MASDNFDDRRRESNAFLDRRRDALDAERRRAERSSALFKALEDKDHRKASWILGIPPTQPVDAAADARAIQESPEALVARIHELRQRIARAIANCSLLPAALRNDWNMRLAKLTDGNCVAELESLRRDVKSAYERRTCYFDYRQVSKSMDLEGDLSLLEMELGSLRDLCSDYLSKE